VSEATPFARTVVLDEIARQALDYICEHWEGGELAWLVIEWVLAREEDVGRLLTVEFASVRIFWCKVHQTARSVRHIRSVRTSNRGEDYWL
jgi:hypothetical protein